jgi:hypothetical protein
MGRGVGIGVGGKGEGVLGGKGEGMVVQLIRAKHKLTTQICNTKGYVGWETERLEPGECGNDCYKRPPWNKDSETKPPRRAGASPGSRRNVH